jgi:hypothetical protein
MSTLTSAKFEDIDAHTEEWWLGNWFSGDIARVIVRDGLDGDLIANPDANSETPGVSSFTDGAGNTWTADDGDAELVALASAGASTVDVVSNVATSTILGRTTAGSGDSEELSAATVKTFLGISATAETLLDDASTAAMRTTLGVAPAPRLVVAGQYTASTMFASVTSGLTNNRLYHVPVHIPRDLTVTRLAVNQIATGSAGAGSVGKFGIYNSTSDLPAAAFDLPAGTIDLETGTGLKYVSGSWALTAGVWWISFVAQVTSGSPTFGTGIPSIVVSGSDTTHNGVKFQNTVTGALPDPAVPGVSNATSAPIIFLYV